jgi:alkaline phosphatase
MTAGVKTRNDILGLDQRARLDDCAGSKSKHVTTLWEMAEEAGLATGVVTTARLTHATPAATYAHSASRDWESDADMPPDAREEGCADIARQLIELAFGDGFEVALGGGREKFLPRDAVDPADAKTRGTRQDGRDLIKAWQDRYGAEGAYVSNAQQLAKVNPARTAHVLGLFAPSQMAYDSERAASSPSEPSLADMTAKAIDVLSRSRKGFILMVEAGRIDHGSHEGKAYLTLSETVALNEAVKAALAKVSAKDTLIIVTADHSHTLTIGGYVKRNNPILGLAVDVNGKLARADDGLPYTTLSFANGPGGLFKGKRADLAHVDTAAPGFVQQALVPLRGETHAGEDVAIYAIGPSAHLFQGTVEQNYIFHVMAHALRLSARTAQAKK